jgi:hypothetical protein
MSTRASTSASRRTPFTVQAMHPQGPPPPSLRLDWLARLLASRPGTANAWPVVIAQVHLHLGPRRTRRPALRRVGWAGERRRVQRPSGHGWHSSPAGNCSAACLWRRYPPLPSTEVAPPGPSSTELGPRWVRATTVSHGRQRSRTVINGSEEPQVASLSAHAASLM